MRFGTLVVRQGKPGGGKGALFAEGRAQCLGTGAEQTLIIERETWNHTESIHRGGANAPVRPRVRRNTCNRSRRRRNDHQ